MAQSPSKDIWAELRKPFPKEVVGKIPKGGIMLDYVGHAAVTDRLLAVDPAWTWEPMATDEHGAPMAVNGNLWIRLTINGVTRIGVGDGKNAKECIGDAIRNAAMRFGVALDLWSKEELESTLDNPELKNEKPSVAKPAVGTTVTMPVGVMPVTPGQAQLLLVKFQQKSGNNDKVKAMDEFESVYGWQPMEVPSNQFNQIMEDLKRGNE